jgi:hypothetical protein
MKKDLKKASYLNNSLAICWEYEISIKKLKGWFLLVLLGIYFAMFSKSTIDYLISLPKTINGGHANINIQDDKTRIMLKAESEPEYDFLVEISSG